MLIRALELLLPLQESLICSLCFDLIVVVVVVGPWGKGSHWIQLLEVLPYKSRFHIEGEPVSLAKVFRLFRLEWISWKFYLIKANFTLGEEPVSLVKVFRLFRLEWIFWKFYLIKANFTLGESVSLVKVFRLFRLEWILWKFYLIRADFTLDEPVSLVKVFRLFRLEWIFFGVQSVDTVGRCRASYLLAGPVVCW